MLIDTIGNKQKVSAITRSKMFGTINIFNVHPNFRYDIPGKKEKVTTLILQEQNLEMNIYTMYNEFV